MKEFLKNNFAELLCWICKKLDIYIMANLYIDWNRMQLKRLTNTGCMKYCSFRGNKFKIS
jgi:hypothetical protein